MTVSRGSVVVVSLDQTVTWGPYPLDTLAVATKGGDCYSLVGGRGDRATFCLQGDVKMFERLLRVDDESSAVWFRRNMSPLMDPQLRALIPDAPALLSELLQHRWTDESDNLIAKPSRYVRATPVGMVYLDCLLVVTDDLLGLFGLVPGRGYSFFGFGAPSPVPLSSLARVRYGRVVSARSPDACSILGLTLDSGATVFVETNVVGHLSRDPDVEELRKRASALRRRAGLPRVARWLGGPPIRIPSPEQGGSR